MRNLNPDPTRRSAFFRLAPTPVRLEALGLRMEGEFLSGASLADARLSRQHHQLAVAGVGRFQGSF